MEEGGALRASVNEGNPNLDPYTAMNFELEDEYVGDRTTVDINATYQFQTVLGEPELLLQVENFTNEPEVFQTGRASRLGFHYLSGRTLTVGVSTEF